MSQIDTTTDDTLDNTITQSEATYLAEQVRGRDERNHSSYPPEGRAEYIDSMDVVNNTTDYILVEALADSVPTTALTVEECFNATSLDELLLTIVSAHLDTVGLDKLLRTIDITYDTRAINLPELSNTIQPPTIPDTGELEYDEMTYTVVESTTYAGQGRPGERTPRTRPLAKLWDEVAYNIYRDIVDELTVEELPDVVERDILLDGVTELEDRGYLPDTLVISPDTEDDLPAYATAEFDVVHSAFVPENIAYVADSTVLGYSAILSDPEIELHTELEHSLEYVPSCDPLVVRTKQRRADVVTNDNAVVQTHITGQSKSVTLSR